MATKLICTAVCVFILAGCIKEESTRYKAYLVNNTSHRIELRPVYRGQTVLENVLNLTPNTTIEIANGSEYGKNSRGGFSSKYFFPMDSMHVIFDDTFQVSHYGETPTSFSRRFYVFDSSRNVISGKSYVLVYRDVSKYLGEAKYTYTFTEQDYLYAR